MDLPFGVGAPWLGTGDAVGVHHVPASDRKGEQQPLTDPSIPFPSSEANVKCAVIDLEELVH